MIFFPTLLISLLFHVKRHYKALLLSIIITAPIFLIWDFLATGIRSWSFNPKWVLGIYVIDLPIEEVLFFVVTPFATLLIYDFVQSKMKDHTLSSFSQRNMGIFALVLLILGFFASDHSYTFIDLIYASLSIFLVELFDKDLFTSRNYWVFLLLTYIPFLIFDYFLTSLPVVIYGHNSILNIRVFTIPIEDFIYSFSMMNIYTLFYRRGMRIWI
ncbi:lycopene cyclase domain-containing protein [Metallosphaera hakonensis]|nr:lycopene cyclase domain-containing protein [Metallosphaera hakonensis]